MKKILFLAAAMVGMTFAACNNGTATETVENDSISADSVEVVDTTAVDSIVADSVVAE